MVGITAGGIIVIIIATGDSSTGLVDTTRPRRCDSGVSETDCPARAQSQKNSRQKAGSK
jgi:hypothetical protein